MKSIMRLMIGGVFAAFLGGTASAEGVEVPEVRNLAEVGAHSKAQHLPVLLVFSAEDCAYCKRLEEEFLKPMLISGEYDRKVIIRKVMIDGYGKLRDFDGSEIDVDQFTDRYDVSVTPTVMFLDAGGRMLARKLIGLNSVDFYGAYLDQAIDNAYGRLNRPL